jgi:hypothetical protein
MSFREDMGGYAGSLSGCDHRRAISIPAASSARGAPEAPRPRSRHGATSETYGLLLAGRTAAVRQGLSREERRGRLDYRSGSRLRGLGLLRSCTAGPRKRAPLVFCAAGRLSGPG